MCGGAKRARRNAPMAEPPTPIIPVHSHRNLPLPVLISPRGPHRRSRQYVSIVGKTPSQFSRVSNMALLNTSEREQVVKGVLEGRARGGNVLGSVG